MLASCLFIMLSIHYTRISLPIRNVHLNSFFVNHVLTSKNLQHGVRIVKSIKLWNLSNSNVNIFNHFHLIDSLTKVFYSYFNTCGTFYIGVVFRIRLSNYDSLTNMEKSFLCKNESYVQKVVSNVNSYFLYSFSILFDLIEFITQLFQIL